MILMLSVPRVEYFPVKKQKSGFPMKKCL